MNYKIVNEKVLNVFKKNINIGYLSVTYIFLVILFFPRVFSSNDDLAIMQNIENGLNPQFMSIVLGRLISMLYTINDKINWYVYFLYFTNLLIVYTSFNILTKLKIGKEHFIMSGVIFVLIFAKFVMAIGYNYSAILIGGVGTIYFFTLLQESDRKIKKSEIFYCGLLFGAAFLIRKETIVALIVFLAPFFIYYFFRKRNIIFVFLIPFFILFLAETTCYAFLPNYEKTFVEYNGVRGKIHGNSQFMALRTNEVILSKIGWTKSEYDGFLNFFFPDEIKFSKEKLEILISEKKKLNKYFYTMKNMKGLFISTLNQYKGRILSHNIELSFLLLTIALTVGMTLNKKRIFLFVLYIIYFNAIVIMLFIFARFPERIGNPLLYISVISTILFTDKLVTINRNKKAILLIAYAGLLCFSIESIAENIKNSRLAQERTYYTYNFVQNKGYKYIMVGLRAGVCINPEMMDPLKLTNDKVEIVPFGWQTFSPLYYKYINENFQAENTKELMKNISTRNDTAILLRENDEVIFNEYLRNNFGNLKLKREYILIEDYIGRLGIYGIRK